MSFSHASLPISSYSRRRLAFYLPVYTADADFLHHRVHSRLVLLHSYAENTVCFDLCFSKTMEYEKCVDATFCAESDGELYQLYLTLIGAQDGFTFLCANDTFSGLSRSRRNFLNSRRMNLRQLVILL